MNSMVSECYSGGASATRRTQTQRTELAKVEREGVTPLIEHLSTHTRTLLAIYCVFGKPWRAPFKKKIG